MLSIDNLTNFMLHSFNVTNSDFYDVLVTLHFMSLVTLQYERNYFVTNIVGKTFAVYITARKQLIQINS